MKCGFDEQFAKLLKKHFDTKSPMQRHGVLLFDEINLRKSIAVCSKNLTYVGLTDFGDDGPQSINIEDQATHGLILMFQPLADSYAQPIAVFASKNPIKGEELAKIVIKAIAYLEMSGAKIHGVIGDGATTNAKMWSWACQIQWTTRKRGSRIPEMTNEKSSSSLIHRMSSKIFGIGCTIRKNCG